MKHYLHKITKNMLNDWIFLARIRNYFCTGFFLDFFVKKTALKFLINSMQFSIMFLEKFIIEKLFKSVGCFFSFTTYLQSKFNYKLMGFLFAILNITLLLLVLPYNI